MMYIESIVRRRCRTYIWVWSGRWSEKLQQTLDRMNEWASKLSRPQQTTNKRTHNLLRETLNGYAAAVAAVADEKPEIQYACLLCALVSSKMPANLFYNSFFRFFLRLNFAFNNNTFFLFFWPADGDHFSIVFCFKLALFENTINFTLKLKRTLFFTVRVLERLSISNTSSQLTLVNSCFYNFTHHFLRVNYITEGGNRVCFFMSQFGLWISRKKFGSFARKSMDKISNCAIIIYKLHG